MQRTLKILAILLVFLDHIYEMFGAFGADVANNARTRSFSYFVSADSFYYTYNRKAYLKRLLFYDIVYDYWKHDCQSIFHYRSSWAMNNAFGFFLSGHIYLCLGIDG